MQRKEWTEIYASDVAPAAETYADGIHQQLAVSMVEGLTAGVEDFEGELDEKLVQDVMLPAMKRDVFLHLAALCKKSAEGWQDVYARGFNEVFLP